MTTAQKLREAEHEIKRLRAIIDKDFKTAAELEYLHYEKGELKARLLHPMTQFLAEMMVKEFELFGGINYVTWMFTHPTKGNFELRVQRLNGDSIEILKSRLELELLEAVNYLSLLTVPASQKDLVAYQEGAKAFLKKYRESGGYGKAEAAAKFLKMADKLLAQEAAKKAVATAGTAGFVSSPPSPTPGTCPKCGWVNNLDIRVKCRNCHAPLPDSRVKEHLSTAAKKAAPEAKS